MLAAFVIFAGIAGLFALQPRQTFADNSSCTVLSSNLFIGSFDFSSNGGVTSLQNFLVNDGYLNHTPTGFFGALTYAAVVRFQSAYGIPATGFVGPLTRGEIQALTCVNNPNPVPTPVPGVVSISSIQPGVGPAGTNVTLTGFGFTNSNTVYFSGFAIQNIGMISANSIVFTVPSAVGANCTAGMMCPDFLRLITPGTYPVYVANANGTSNTVNFTVTDSNSNGSSLSITGVSGPNSIPISTPGTWTVNASAPYGTNLNYTVNWGDQNNMAASNIVAPQYGSLQSSATFTHAYSQAGTYNATFTVSDSLGHSTSTSVSVFVTPIY